MPVHMKKHPTDDKELEHILIMGQRFLAPRKTVEAIFTFILTHPEVKKEDPVLYDTMVEKKIKKIGKGAMALRGARARENMTIKQLAKIVGINETKLAKMEKGKLKITKKLAQSLEKIFKINFKVFLQ